MDDGPKFYRKEIDMATDTKVILSSEQYLELENKKLENEFKIEQMKVQSAEKIAAENNKVAAEANKVGFWGNVVNIAKIVLYAILAVVGLLASIASKRDDQAYELSDSYRAKESSKWSQRLFDTAMKRIENLKN